MLTKYRTMNIEDARDILQKKVLLKTDRKEITALMVNWQLMATIDNHKNSKRNVTYICYTKLLTNSFLYPSKKDG